jgi:hypothetical protein
MDAGPTWAEWAVVVTAAAAVVIAVAVPVTAYLRRPSLRLIEEGAARHSHIESDGLAYLRLVVENGRRRRAAKETRVIVEGYRRQSESEEELRSLAHPSLGWPSAVEARLTAAAVTIYSGSGRPVEFGRFIRARRSPEGRLAREAEHIAHYATGDPDATWHFMLGLHELSISDDRDKLPPGQWIVRLLVGADDGDAYRCNVHLAWNESSPDAETVLRDALEHLAIVRV